MPQCHTTLCQAVFKVEKREEVLEKINLVSPQCCCCCMLLYLTLSPVTSVVFLSVFASLFFCQWPSSPVTSTCVLDGPACKCMQKALNCCHWKGVTVTDGFDHRRSVCRYVSRTDQTAARAYQPDVGQAVARWSKLCCQDISALGKAWGVECFYRRMSEKHSETL